MGTTQPPRAVHRRHRQQGLLLAVQRQTATRFGPLPRKRRRATVTGPGGRTYQTGMAAPAAPELFVISSNIAYYQKFTAAGTPIGTTSRRPPR